MSNLTINIVRAAFREIQRLSHKYFEDVAKILKKMREGNLGEYRKLEGYKNLWRTKRNDVRVIWTKFNSDGIDEILIVKAGIRKDIYRNVIENKSRQNLLTLADILDIDEDKLDNIPTYRWDNFQSDSWYEFVYGGYLYSPVITAEQKDIFTQLQTNSSNITSPDFSKINSLLVQSAPGTGKTVCATLISCELHSSGWNVILILPENLCVEVKKFTAIKEIVQSQTERFFIGTFQEWLSHSSPYIYQKIATPSEELCALQREANRRVREIPKSQEIGYRELILYKSFVISRYKNNQYNHPIYSENEALIEKLKYIDKDKWLSQLNNKISWIDGVYLITENNPSPNLADKTFVIFDEAQDYLIDELKAIIIMLERWQSKNNHTSILCLLGDMNQRIQPVDFDWGQLHLNSRKYLKYNYRNTKSILEFANIFHTFAKNANLGKRHLPEINNPENTFEDGESVRLLECSSYEEALKTIAIISAKIKNSNTLEQYSLLKLLSSRIKLIYKNIPKEYKNFSGIDYLDVKQAKGREFDVCIAFCIFNGQGIPSFEEANNWYTILTRPRYRLLLIATTDEINRIGRHYFHECQYHKHPDLDSIEWITEWANGENYYKDIEVVCNLIYEGLRNNPVQVYWDTYAALRLAQISENSLLQIEHTAIALIKQHSVNVITNELRKIKQVPDIVDQIPLRCLLLRALGNYWQAIKEASQLESIDHQEYQNLILRIADELDSKGFLYEAARARTKIGADIPRKFPFSKEISNQDGSLVSLLCKAAINRLSHR